MSQDLDQISSIEQFDNIEDKYSLSPAQLGMLLHTLREPNANLFFQQNAIHLNNPDIPLFITAWQQVVKRHPILRTSFHWEGIELPIQVVHPHVDLPITYLDWRNFAIDERRQRIKKFLREDQKRTWILTCAPLLRLAIIQITDTSYLCVRSNHHLLLDGWSNSIIMEEAYQLYQALRRGEQLIYSQPRPYYDYIKWIGQQDLALAEIFWKKQLNNFMAPTVLPYQNDINLPKVKRGFIHHRHLLPVETTNRLRSIAQSWRITVSTVVQGIWGILLSFLSNEDDVVFGITVSGRPAELIGVERMVGLFINALPLRVTVSQYASLKSWFLELHDKILHIQSYEYNSLAQIQNWSSVPRGTPLFESLVTFNSAALSEKNRYQSDALSSSTKHENNAHFNLTNYPLSLSINDGAALKLEITVDAQRFGQGAIIRLLDQFQTICTGVIENTNGKVLDLSIMQPSELRLLIKEWNYTDTHYRKSICLHHLFEDSARSNPDAIALSFEDQNITYAQLNRQANQLAHYLIARGIQPENLVGLSVERSLLMVLGVLAILKAGAAYVPLDPDYPTSRIQFMLEDSKAAVLLTQQRFIESWGNYQLSAICLDSDSHLWDEYSHENPTTNLHPENLALVIYTSGSSGMPKGVAIPHRVCVNRMYIEPYPFSKNEALCIKTSLSFIDSIWEMFAAWTHGLSTHIIPNSQVRDAALLIAALAKARVTRLVLVPSLLRAMLESGLPIAQRLPLLKYWICSGEALPSDLSRAFTRQLPGRILVNLYGASEIWDATQCDASQRSFGDKIPIGKPMGNCQVYVLDRNLMPVPVGVVGELYVGGAGLARGYYARPDLTAERFIPDPFSAEHGARLYCTGDQVHWTVDGQLNYLGRVDNQIKLRGFRIELNEIEAVLRSHPKIRQAAVVVTEQQQLAAYLVLDSQDGISVAEVQALTRKHLPEYMIPVLFFPLDALPLTPSGKINRRALPAPSIDPQRHIHLDIKPPSSEVEIAVANIWSQVLKIEQISIDDNFFGLGGHSLLAMQIVSRLRAKFQIAVPVNVIFDKPTIAEIALWIESAKQQAVVNDHDINPPLESTQLADRDDGIRQAPQSFAQQRLWFLAQLAPGSALYNTISVIPLLGRFNARALQATLDALVERHEMLRTTFNAVDGEPLQIIAATASVDYATVDLSTIPYSQRQARFQQLRRSLLNQAFDLANGPLLRFSLAKLTTDQHLLIVVMHHIITDGWSMNILRLELLALYQSYKLGRVAKLPLLPLQYADFAIWERTWLNGQRLEKHIAYWKQMLAGVEHLQLPTDYPRPELPSYASASYPVALSPETTQYLRDICHTESTTLFVGLLAAFQAILAIYTNQDDIVVGAAVANRERQELEGLIGFFANTLAMRTDLSGNLSFRTLLRRVREVCLGAFQHQALPFERLVEEIAPRRQLGLQPLFQVLFVLQNDIGGENTGDQQVTNEGQGLIFYDLTLALNESPQGCSGVLHYSTELFKPTTIQKFIERFICLLNSAVAQPDYELNRIDLLDDKERQCLFSTWYQEAVLPTCGLHQLFENSAMQYPDRVALESVDQVLTYADLNNTAHNLAQHLHLLGVKSESRIGLFLERSSQALIALLGILKAGGVYIPLDTGLPLDRIMRILHDSQPEIILTNTDLRSILPNDFGKICCIDEQILSDAAAHKSQQEATITVSPAQLAYILFTSGSTGHPKGVMVEHRNIVQTITNQLPVFRLVPGDRVLMTHALTFDASLGEIFRTLASGATLCIAPHEQLLPSPELLTLIKDRHISAVTLSAVLLAALPYIDLPELKILTVGGSALPAAVAERWSRGRRMINGYGPTETAIGVTLADNWATGCKPPLGRPLSNVRAYVVNDALQLLPIGLAGELCLGGPGVARGYLGRADLTAERFIPDPFSGITGARLYRTGDLVRWLDDGQLDFLGRIDEQVKIRGYRVEPGEVTALLRNHPKIKDAAVIARTDHNAELRLVAYVVLHKHAYSSVATADAHVMKDINPDTAYTDIGSNITVESNEIICELRDYVAQQLPEYMLPWRFMEVAALPLTVNGKLDYKALPMPDIAAISEHTTYQYVAPNSELEKLLAAIWGELLRLDIVGVHDNFFDLGGDSILGIKMIARAAEAGAVITAQMLYRNQTIAELSAAIQHS